MYTILRSALDIGFIVRLYECVSVFLLPPDMGPTCIIRSSPFFCRLSYTFPWHGSNFPARRLSLSTPLRVPAGGDARDAPISSRLFLLLPSFFPCFSSFHSLSLATLPPSDRPSEWLSRVVSDGIHATTVLSCSALPCLLFLETKSSYDHVPLSLLHSIPFQSPSTRSCSSSRRRIVLIRQEKIRKVFLCVHAHQRIVTRGKNSFHRRE
jgi:hypothetical protein